MKHRTPPFKMSLRDYDYWLRHENWLDQIRLVAKHAADSSLPIPAEFHPPRFRAMVQLYKSGAFADVEL